MAASTPEDHLCENSFFCKNPEIQLQKALDLRSQEISTSTQLQKLRKTVLYHRVQYGKKRIYL